MNVTTKMVEAALEAHVEAFNALREMPPTGSHFPPTGSAYGLGMQAMRAALEAALDEADEPRAAAGCLNGPTCPCNTDNGDTP